MQNKTIILSCKTGHQDRKFENARKKEFLFTKFKSQIILLKKNGLNVEHFHYHKAINYKLWHALINQNNYDQIMCLCKPMEKVSRKSAIRKSLEPCH